MKKRYSKLRRPIWFRGVIDCSAVGSSKLVSQEFFGRDLPVGSPRDGVEVLSRDHRSPTPLRDATLSHANTSGELLLPTDDLDSPLNSAHRLEISGAINHSQERRYWENNRRSISVADMDRDPKRSKPNAADLAAAARLRKIRDAIPRRDQPRQEDIAEKLGATQAMVSHYLNGRAKLNYRAVLVFADVYKCRPEDIRDDLPEMKAERGYAESIRENFQVSDVDAVWDLYTPEQKAKLLEIGRVAIGPPSEIRQRKRSA